MSTPVWTAPTKPFRRLPAGDNAGRPPPDAKQKKPTPSTSITPSSERDEGLSLKRSADPPLRGLLACDGTSEIGFFCFATAWHFRLRRNRDFIFCGTGGLPVLWARKPPQAAFS